MNKILVSDSTGKKVINTHKIIYFEADGKYSRLFMTRSKHYLISKCLKELEIFLNTGFFCRIHRKYLINLNYLEEFTTNSESNVILKKGIKLPVAFRRKRKVNDCIKNFFNS